MSIQSLSLFGYQGKNSQPAFGGNYSHQGIGSVNPYSSKVSSPMEQQKQGASDGLVARLDRMDASMLKPEQKCDTRANKLDFFA